MDDQNLPSQTDYVFTLPPVVESLEYAQQVAQENADRGFVLGTLAKIYGEGAAVSESDPLQADMQQLSFILARNGWRLDGQLLIEPTGKNNPRIRDATDAPLT